MSDHFRRFARWLSNLLGAPSAFVLALIIILVWAATGPIFHYSDTWQLIINTGTTVITFLMVFIIQNTQNRDSRAMHLKMDELIRANKAARNKLLNLEDMSDKELEALHGDFCQLQKQYDDQAEMVSNHRKQRKR